VDLINTIQIHQNNFSKTEKKVAEYILQNPELVETHTIIKIATESNTSTSAVLRFCQSLGFKGYKDFRYEMVQYLHNNHKPLDSTDLFNQLTNTYMQILTQFKNIDKNMINELVNDILEYHPIYITGIYYSSLPAKQLSMGLLDLGFENTVVNDYISIEHVSHNISSNAIMIHFSLSGQRNEFQRLVPDLLKNMPEKSYLITMNENADIGNAFTHKIILPGLTFKNQSVFDIQSISMIFIEIILNLIHNEL